MGTDPASNVYVDVGASIGEFSSHVLAKDPRARVYAVEPNIDYCKDFLTNIQDLNVGRMFIEFSALAKTTGSATFYGSKVLGGNIGSLKRINPEKSWDDYLNNHLDKSLLNQEIIIKTISVNEFISRNNLSKIDFLKIDAQGSDIEILELFLSEIPVECSVLEVNTLSTSSENIYLSANNLEQLARLICRFDLKILKIVPNSDFTELNIFLAKNEKEGHALLTGLDLGNSITFQRGWQVKVLQADSNFRKNRLIAVLKRIMYFLNHPS